jgi:hypothetical protein
MPGREYPVRVTVETDRLLAGVVRLHAPGPTGESLVEREVEVTGGSTARIDLLAPAWPSDGLGTSGWVDIAVDGDSVAREVFEVRSDPNEDLVGLLPEVVTAAGGADALPATLPFVVDLGAAAARPVALDPDLLALGPLALEPLDQLAADPAELAALPGASRAAVAGWVQNGGQLLLTGRSVDAAGDALPEGWRPEPGASVRAGLGQVRAVGDGWADHLLPSPTRSSWEEDLAASDLFSGAAPLSSEMADSAGLRLPGGWTLAVLLVLYVVLAGPVVFSALRRPQRRQLTWVAVPLLAVGSTGVVFATGSSFRRSLASVQVTVYETGPAGTTATSWSLLANRDGGEVGVALPEGWVAGESLPDEMIAMGIESRTATRTVAGPGGSDAEALVETPVAGYGAVQARGAVSGMDDALVVTATSDAEGLIHGTVRNRLDVTLDEVAVFAGRMGVVDVGTLGPGDEAEYTIENATVFAWGQSVEQSVWPVPEMGWDVGPGPIPLPAPMPMPIPDDGGGVVQILPAPGAAEAEVELGALPRKDVLVLSARDEAQAKPGQEAPVPTVVPAPPPVVVGPDGAPVPGGVDIGKVGDGDDGDDDEREESPVVTSAWAAIQRRVGWNFRPTGQVVAAGWTDELDAPVGPSSGAGPVRSSRSAVVARATVAAAGDRLSDAAVVRDMVRGPVTESAGGDEVGAVWAFSLPDTVGDRPVDTRRLVMNQGSGFNRAELWTPGGWVPVDIPATGEAEVAVPPAAVVDGVVLYRWAVPVAIPASGGRDLTIYEKEAPR